MHIFQTILSASNLDFTLVIYIYLQLILPFCKSQIVDFCELVAVFVSLVSFPCYPCSPSSRALHIVY